MCAMSEVQWCAADAKDYARFEASLEHSFGMFDAMGMSYCLDHKGLIGLERIPARTPEELEEYLNSEKQSW